MSWHGRSPGGEKSPEFELLAQLCGAVGVSVNIYSLYDTLRKCLALGERGWLVAVALLNVALGGNVPVPDLVSAVPPGYARYITRVALVDDKVLYELIRDVPLRTGSIEVGVPVKEGEEQVTLAVEFSRFPMAFGVLVEYEHPEYGLERSLWVFHYVGTGDYPFRAFLVPRAVADEVAKLADSGGFAVEKPEAYSELHEEARRYVSSLVERYGSVEAAVEALRRGEVIHPTGISVRVAEHRGAEEEEGRRRHRRSPK